MSPVVVDTDVASYLFNWHSLAESYAKALRGSDLVLSFMSVAELRMGALSAGWGGRRRELLERFIGGFEVFYADDRLCSVWASVRAKRRAMSNGTSYESARRLGCSDCAWPRWRVGHSQSA